MPSTILQYTLRQQTKYGHPISSRRSCLLSLQPNHYILRIPETANTNAAALAERPIHFTTAYKNLPVPDARLLALHACCAQAAQLSGLSHFLTQLDRDIEATPVMAEDGTSAFLLDVLLTRVALASTQP